MTPFLQALWVAAFTALTAAAHAQPIEGCTLLTDADVLALLNADVSVRQAGADATRCTLVLEGGLRVVQVRATRLGVTQEQRQQGRTTVYNRLRASGAKVTEERPCATIVRADPDTFRITECYLDRPDAAIYASIEVSPRAGGPESVAIVRKVVERAASRLR
jgi:hypothetical protein